MLVVVIMEFVPKITPKPEAPDTLRLSEAVFAPIL
jgi:hypothetical protein